MLPEKGTVSELFGKRLRFLRRAKKMSQEGLAARAGCDISTLGRTERGEVSPTVRMVERLARALDVTLIELFDFSGQRPDGDEVARLKDQVQVLITESDSSTLELGSFIMNELIRHGRRMRSQM